MNAVPPTQPLDVVARFVATDFSKAHPELEPALAAELALRIETALRAAVREEREACARVCDSRRGLWQSASENAKWPAHERATAEARATEAAYIADALRAR